jgi:polysaccharide export outer membrane protein
MNNYPQLYFPRWCCQFASRGVATIALALCAVVLMTSGCKTTKKTSPPPGFERGAATGSRPTILAPGDVVRLVFPGAPENNQSQKIRADGKISLPMVGEVVAAGRRPADLQSELTALYKGQLVNNEVVVTLESGAVPVYISGAIRKPGKMVFDRPTNLLEVITEAGGLSPEANLKKVRITRVVNGIYRSQTINLKPALSGEPSRAYYVQPGDIIYIGANFINF